MNGMANKHDGRALWVFGYGSLMWDPGFPHEASVAARAHGWHRRFSLLSTRSWGTPEVPGLCLALHPGGSAAGRAFRVSAAAREEALAYLEARESAYRHRIVTVRLEGGAPAKALTFIHDPRHERHAGELPLGQIVTLIRQGRGPKGTSHEYLARTVAELERIGVRQSTMHRLLEAVGPWRR